MVITRGLGTKNSVVDKKEMDRIVDFVIEAIKAKLKEKNLSQRDLANKIGKTEAWVSRKIGEDIKTKRRLTVEDLRLIARGLDCYPSDFFPKRLEDEICNLPLTEFIRNICRHEIKSYLDKNNNNSNE